MISVTKLAPKSFSYVLFLPCYKKNQLSFSGKIQIFYTENKQRGQLIFLSLVTLTKQRKMKWTRHNNTMTLLWISNAMEYPLDKLQLNCFFWGTKNNVPYSTLSVGNQFTKVMFELFLTGIFIQDIFSFYRNVCSTNLKQTWDEKLLIFPCVYFWNSYFVISACIDAMKKNERPYDFNLRQNTPMGVTSRGRDLKNFKSRALLVQWRQILCEIAFQILLRWDFTIY